MSEEIKKLVKKNLELNQEIYEMLKSVKRYVLIQQIFSVLKILIIVIPIILGIIYLPPLFEKYIPQINKTVEQYQSLLNLGGGDSLDVSGEKEISSEQLKDLSPGQVEK